MRAVLAVPLLLWCGLSPAAELPAAIAAFSQAAVGRSIGSGECCHLASEALRACGAVFERHDIGPDLPGDGDYVWGTPLATIEPGKPAGGMAPGDILQFRDARIRAGAGVITRPHHTAVVAAVDGAGHVTAVYEQNVRIGGAPANRTVMRRDLDGQGLTAGWIRAYRAIPRRPAAGLTEVSILNQTAVPVTVTNLVGDRPAGTFVLGIGGSETAYMTRWLQSAGAMHAFALADGRALRLEDAAAYEIVAGTGPQPLLRRVAPTP